MGETRIRSRGTYKHHPYVVKCDGVIVDECTATSCMRAEAISDELGDPLTWHDVSHVVTKCTFGTMPEFDSSDPEMGGSKYTYEGYMGAVGIDGDLCPLVPAPLPPGRAAQISHRFLTNATTQIPMKVSIANFLLEMKNPKESLLPRVQNWASHKTPAEILLWWKFGLEPTIRDVKALLRVWADTVKRLNHLRKINRRTVTLHYATFVKWTPDSLPLVADATWWDPLAPWYNGALKSREGKVVVTGQVTYNLQGLDEPLAFWDSLAASLNLNNPLGIKWESIPFSFVVDWFVNVGDFIDTYNPGKNTFDGDIVVSSCGYSLKYVEEIQLFLPTERSVHEWSECGSISRDCYFRRQGLPEGALDTGGLTPMQQLLGAALIIANGGKSRQRRRRRDISD